MVLAGGRIERFKDDIGCIGGGRDSGEGRQRRRWQHRGGGLRPLKLMVVDGF
jgi:hypothetical protein